MHKLPHPPQSPTFAVSVAVVFLVGLFLVGCIGEGELSTLGAITASNLWAPAIAAGLEHAAMQLNGLPTTVPSWASLAADAAQRAADASAKLQVAGRRGTWNLAEGPPSAQARTRTFGTDPSKIRVTFYRDNHAWCPYCHKVWLQLEEKRIPHRVEKVCMKCYGKKSVDFLRKVPKGLIPVLELDGKIITESSVIMQKLEETFPEYQPLLPPEGSVERVEAEEIMQLERTLLQVWMNWIRGPESEWLNSMPGGNRNTQQFLAALNATEEALSRKGGPYFLGNVFSLVDCVFASSLERIAATALYYKGLKIRCSSYPRISEWFSEMEQRPAYRAAQSDYHTHIHDLPPQMGPLTSTGTAEQQAMSAALDGTDRKSWSLPLPCPDSAPEVLNKEIEDPSVDRLEAALAFLHHHDKIVRTACAAAGAHESTADKAYRETVAALLRDSDVPDQRVPALDTEEGKVQVARALRFTRDRICVPRDMGMTAARQLRAHLNWFADLLDPEHLGEAIPIPIHHRRDTDPHRFGNTLNMNL